VEKSVVKREAGERVRVSFLQKVLDDKRDSVSRDEKQKDDWNPVRLQGRQVKLEGVGVKKTFWEKRGESEEERA
jgi:hypothetical protein